MGDITRNIAISLLVRSFENTHSEPTFRCSTVPPFPQFHSIQCRLTSHKLLGIVRTFFRWVFVLDHRVLGLRSSFLGLRFRNTQSYYNVLLSATSATTRFVLESWPELVACEIFMTKFNKMLTFGKIHRQRSALKLVLSSKQASKVKSVVYEF